MGVYIILLGALIIALFAFVFSYIDDHSKKAKQKI